VEGAVYERQRKHEHDSTRNKSAASKREFQSRSKIGRELSSERPREGPIVLPNDQVERPCGAATFEALYRSRPLQPIVKRHWYQARRGRLLRN
jgi:hypothetical protein